MSFTHRCMWNSTFDADSSTRNRQKFIFSRHHVRSPSTPLNAPGLQRHFKHPKYSKFYHNVTPGPFKCQRNIILSVLICFIGQRIDYFVEIAIFPVTPCSLYRHSYRHITRYTARMHAIPEWTWTFAQIPSTKLQNVSKEPTHDLLAVSDCFICQNTI